MKYTYLNVVHPECALCAPRACSLAGGASATLCYTQYSPRRKCNMLMASRWVACCSSGSRGPELRARTWRQVQKRCRASWEATAASVAPLTVASRSRPARSARTTSECRPLFSGQAPTSPSLAPSACGGASSAPAACSSAADRGTSPGAMAMPSALLISSAALSVLSAASCETKGHQRVFTRQHHVRVLGSKPPWCVPRKPWCAPPTWKLCLLHLHA